jgi:hypothetical protein
MMRWPVDEISFKEWMAKYIEKIDWVEMEAGL